jgi:hypothetical protein
MERTDPVTRREKLGFFLLGLALVLWVVWLGWLFADPLGVPVWPIIVTVPKYFVGLGMLLWGEWK